MKKEKVLFKYLAQILPLFLVISSIPFYNFNQVYAKDMGTQEDNDLVSTENQKGNEQAGLKEIPELRNAKSKVFMNEEGTYIAEVYLEPIHYKENNQWIEIYNTLVSSEDNQYFENEENEFKVKFPKKPFQSDDMEVFTYQTKGHEMQIELVTEESSVSTQRNEVQEVLPTVKGNQIVLEEPIEDVTFEYVIDGSKVKENIILHSYQGKNTFQFDLNVNNLEAKKQEDGSIHFYDQKGNFVFLIERPYMYDSNTEVGPEGEISQDVTQEIEKTEDGYLLTITADEEFLTDPKRVYPVTIDPWIDVYQAEDTFVASNSSSNYHNTDYLSVGYHSTLGKTRSLLKFDLPMIPNGEVTDAALILNQIYDSAATQVNVHQVTSPFTTSTVTWANQPTYESSSAAFNTLSASGPAEFSITEMVQGWYEQPNTNYGLLLKFPDTLEGSALQKRYYSSESTSDLAKKPKLQVTFKSLDLLGLTDYWTYTPDNFQGEGTAVVNVINGNLVYNISLLNLVGKTDAFQLDLTYNSRSAYNGHYGLGWMFNAQESLFINHDKSIIEYRTEGGARYHFVKQEGSETMYRSPEGAKQFELTRTVNGFELKDTAEIVRYFDTHGRNYEIKDEKGNAILYTFENETSTRVTKITERNGTTDPGRSISLAYDQNGNLYTVTDFKGNTTSLVYDTVNGQNVLWKIKYATGTEIEKTIEFSYDPISARLNSIKDANGNVGKIEYDPVTQQVKKLIDPRNDAFYSSLEYGTNYTIYTDSTGNKTKYEYSTTTDADTKEQFVNVTKITENYLSELAAKWEYVWKDNRITNIIEPNKTTGELDPNTATAAAYTEDTGELISIETTGNQSIHIDRTGYDKNNVIKVLNSAKVADRYIYDPFSNVISTRTNLGLTDYNQYDRYGNILQSASPTRGSYNRLQNSQFEDVDTSSYPLNWNRYTGTNAGTHQSSTISYIGNRSAKITLSGTDTAGYYTQRFAVDSTENNYYTISTQVKTENVTGEGARIRVYPLDSNNSSLKNPDGSPIIYLSKPLTGTLDWTQLSETFMLPDNTAHVRVDLLFKGAGTVYFDAAQVTSAKTLDRYATNENTSFELGSGTTATNWTLNALATGDGRTSTNKKYGTHAMRLTGDSSVNRYTGQLIEMKGKKGDPVTFSGWGYTTNTTDGGNFKLRLWLVHTDGTSKSYDVSFLPEVEIGKINNETLDYWQFAKSTVFAEKDFKQAKIYAIYGERSGTAYFDDIKVEQNGAVSSLKYSHEGTHIESVTGTLGFTSRFEYDANGNQTKVVDEIGNIKSRTYDELDRMTSVSLGSDSNVIQINYQFDLQGNLKKRVNPLGYETSFDYNELNLIKKETDPLGKYSLYDYDGEGFIKKIERGQGTEVSSTVTFEYDTAHNEKSKLINGIKYYDKTYFKNGLLQSIQMANGDVYSYDYDTSGRLTVATSPNYSIKNEYGIESDYDNGLRKYYIESLNGQTYKTTYRHDGLQRSSAITSQKGYVYDYYFNESSQPVRIQSDKATQLNDFDSEGQLITQTILAKDQVQYSYGYNGNGYVTNYFDGKKTHTYTYDFANRLETWNNGSTTVNYVYDNAGNLKNPNGQALTFNAANEVESFTYDLEGNLLNDSRLSYKWDGLGQLTQTTQLEDGQTVTYTYHHDGLRKSKTIGSETYNYHYDDSNLIRITDNQNNTVWAFTWTNEKLVSIINAAGEEFEAITNYRGDVVQILDSTGATIATYDYDPWGNLLSEEPTDPRIQGQPIRYAGYMYDPETKLYYLQARYYDPSTARFISRDPHPGNADEPISMNGYTYADDNPVMMVDPDGNWAFLVPVLVTAGRVLTTVVKAVSKGISKTKGVTKPAKVTKGTPKLTKPAAGDNIGKGFTGGISKTIGNTSINKRQVRVDIEYPTGGSTGNVHIQIKGSGGKQKIYLNSPNDINNLEKSLRKDKDIQRWVNKAFEMLERAR